MPLVLNGDDHNWTYLTDSSMNGSKRWYVDKRGGERYNIKDLPSVVHVGYEFLTPQYES